MGFLEGSDPSRLGLFWGAIAFVTLLGIPSAMANIYDLASLWTLLVATLMLGVYLNRPLQKYGLYASMASLVWLLTNLVETWFMSTLQPLILLFALSSSFFLALILYESFGGKSPVGAIAEPLNIGFSILAVSFMLIWVIIEVAYSMGIDWFVMGIGILSITTILDVGIKEAQYEVYFLFLGFISCCMALLPFLGLV
jgi:hypothetical protein